MKVLLVSTSSGSHGGGEFYLRGLASGLRGLGHHPVTWLSSHSQMDPLADSFKEKELPLHRFEYLNTYHRRWRSLGAAMDRQLQRRVAGELGRSGADIVHINQQCLEDGLDLLRAAADCGIPAVSTIHVTRTAVSLKARAGILRDLVCRRMLRRCGIPLVGISPTSARDLCQFVNDHPTLAQAGEQQSTDGQRNRNTRIHDIPVYAVSNGVALPRMEVREPLREKLGLRPTDILIGVIARIEHQKNPLFMCRLLNRLPDFVHCVWIGDGRMRPELEAEILRCDQAKRFHLLGWQNNASSWLSAFDVFALGSHYEGLPLALLEAMAAGLPCVASRVDGTQDCLTDESDGFLCPVDDVEQWVGTLNRLIESRPFRCAIGEAAQRRYVQEFSLEAMAERTSRVYQDVVQPH